MSGYIKLYRQITDNEFYFKERFSPGSVSIQLLTLLKTKVFIMEIFVKKTIQDLPLISKSRFLGFSNHLHKDLLMSSILINKLK